MDKEIIDIIKQQTNIKDDLVIERAFYEHGNDVVKTIMSLSSIEDTTTRPKTHTLFDNIRQICDEKEKIFHQIKNTLDNNPYK